MLSFAKPNIGRCFSSQNVTNTTEVLRQGQSKNYTEHSIDENLALTQ